MRRISSTPSGRLASLTRPTRIALCALAVVVGLASCTEKANSNSGSGASGASAASASPDPQFFNGKTITWDVPGAPGASFYTTATILAPLVGKYLHATVNIVSIPAGATIAGQNQAAAAPNNGMTIGTLNVSANVSNAATKQPGINFDMQKQAFIAGLPINPDVLVVRPDSQYKTFDDLVQAAPAVKSADYAGSIDILEKGIFGAYGVKAKLISGYSSVPEQVAGFLRGDAEFAVNQVPGLASSIAAGKARPLLVTSPIPPGTAGYNQLKDVPDIASYVAKNQPKTPQQQQAMQAMLALFGVKAVNQVVFAPAGTPPGVVAALADAFKSAINDPGAQKAFITANLSPGYLSPADTDAAITEDIKLESAISGAVTGYKS